MKKIIIVIVSATSLLILSPLSAAQAYPSQLTDSEEITIIPATNESYVQKVAKNLLTYKDSYEREHTIPASALSEKIKPVTTFLSHDIQEILYETRELNEQLSNAIHGQDSHLETKFQGLKEYVAFQKERMKVAKHNLYLLTDICYETFKTEEPIKQFVADIIPVKNKFKNIYSNYSNFSTILSSTPIEELSSSNKNHILNFDILMNKHFKFSGHIKAEMASLQEEGSGKEREAYQTLLLPHVISNSSTPYLTFPLIFFPHHAPATPETSALYKATQAAREAAATAGNYAQQSLEDLRQSVIGVVRSEPVRTTCVTLGAAAQATAAAATEAVHLAQRLTVGLEQQTQKKAATAAQLYNGASSAAAAQASPTSVSLSTEVSTRQSNERTSRSSTPTRSRAGTFSSLEDRSNSQA